MSKNVDNKRAADTLYEKKMMYASWQFRAAVYVSYSVDAPRELQVSRDIHLYRVLLFLFRQIVVRLDSNVR